MPFLIETVFTNSEQNLWYEFLETLINDTEVSEKLRRQIWTLTTMEIVYPSFEHSSVVILIAQEFTSSENTADLCKRWQKIIDSCWQYVPACPLKRELDRL